MDVLSNQFMMLSRSWKEFGGVDTVTKGYSKNMSLRHTGNIITT